MYVSEDQITKKSENKVSRKLNYTYRLYVPKKFKFSKSWLNHWTHMNSAGFFNINRDPQPNFINKNRIPFQLFHRRIGITYLSRVPK